MRIWKILLTIIVLLCCSQITLQAQERAKPKDGDGITTFLQRYHCNTPKLRKEFIRLNKNKFTKDGGLILGKTYLLPEGASRSCNDRTSSNKKKSSTVNEPLLGSRYENVRITSRKLEGACFYLVSGHGGPDPGAISKVGKRELHEDEYAYDIILRLGRCLLSHGAKVHFIIQDAKDGIRNDRYLDNSKRETCMGDPIPLDQVARLQQRCRKINNLTYKDKSRYKRAIFIHVDSRGRSDQVDVFFYHHEGSKYGRRLAENIHQTFEHKYDKHQPNRGFSGTVSARNLYVLKNSNPPGVFLELGNLQNEKDRKRLILESNRQALAEWICQGIIKDFKKQ